MRGVGGNACKELTKAPNGTTKFTLLTVISAHPSVLAQVIAEEPVPTTVPLDTQPELLVVFV